MALSPERRSPLAPFANIARAVQQKGAGGPIPPGTEAGWARPWAGLGGMARSKPRILDTWAGAYGGTRDAVVWVYACANLVATELASYDLDLFTEDEQELEVAQWPDDLRKLLMQPNRDLTWYDMAELIGLDLELVGNSYWLKDQVNGLGQPFELLRLKPEQMEIAKDRAGRKLGYIYRVQGVAVPYNLKEIIHFKYPNPKDELYGMGRVEALQRTLGAHIAETDHIIGFFRDGARVSGVLTTATAMTDTQWERLQQQFKEDMMLDVNGFRLMLLEQGNKFDAITQAPAGSGVIDLVKMTKEEVLAGFGVPDPLLGGLLEHANYKMEEAQHIFARRMRPRATKVAERMTYDLTLPGWGVRLGIDVSYTEPLSVRVLRAKDMLGSGASLNELRGEMNLTPLTEPEADVPLVLATVVPWNQVGRATRSLGLMGTGTTLNELRSEAGLDTINEEWADQPLVPSTITTIQNAAAEKQQPGALPGQPGIPALPPGAPPTEPPVPAVPTTSDDEISEDADPDAPGGDLQRAARAAQRKDPVQLVVPDFGPGWEKLAGAKLVAHGDTVLANALLRDKGRVLAQGVEIILPGMRAFFIEQRKRVIAALGKYGSTSRQVRRGRLAKDAIDPQGLWDNGAEDAQLLAAYIGWVDDLGAEAIQGVGAALGASLSWDLQSPNIGAARDKLGSLITRVNETTRDQVAATVEEGMRRGYSITQIANGFTDEAYPGIQGVFDEAGAARAETIARSETAMIYNAASNAGYRELGIQMVAVLDGDGDEECAAANGSTWTLDDADANPIEHPNCVRSFVPLTAAAADELRVPAVALKGEVVPAAEALIERLLRERGSSEEHRSVLDEIRMRLSEMSWQLRSQAAQPEREGTHVTVQQAPIDASTHVEVAGQEQPAHHVDVHLGDVHVAQPAAAETQVNIAEGAVRAGDVHVETPAPVVTIHMAEQKGEVQLRPRSAIARKLADGSTQIEYTYDDDGED